MNILHVTGMQSQKYGGLERFFVNIAQANPKDHHIVLYNSAVWSDEYARALADVGGEIVINSSTNIIQKFFFLLKLIRKKKIDVIQTYFNILFDGIVALLAAILCGVKRRIHSQHLLVHKEKISWKRKIVLRLQFTICSDLLCVSEGVRKNIASFYPFAAKKTRVIYLGCESNPYDEKTRNEVRDELKIPYDAFLVGNTAFHDPIKGVDILLKAFIEFHKKHPDAYLLQIGNYKNTDGQKNQAFAATSEAAKNIIFLGLTDDVARYLRAMDLFVLSSRTEAISLALMEAAAVGLPMIGSDVGGIPEVIHDGINGFLCPVGNVEAFSRKMADIADNSSLRNQFAQMSEQIYDEHFRLQTQILQYEKFYHER